VDPGPITPLEASWTFNIAGFTDLSLSIDMGAMNNEAFPYNPSTLMDFKYQIDDGPVLSGFSVAPDGTTGGYAYRLMDSGLAQFAHPDGALAATGFSAVTKTLVDTGAVATDTVLDKSPPEGTGAGLLDTFKTAISGTGSQLTLTLSTHLPFEAMIFDNIVIEGTGGPAGVEGDYNGNTIVDAADYVLWQNGGPLLNDPTPGVQPEDFDFWKARFGATSGSGSGFSATTAAVPEPAGFLLGIIGLAWASWLRRRR
jgi:hypothetical protein